MSYEQEYAKFWKGYSESDLSPEALYNMIQALTIDGNMIANGAITSEKLSRLSVFAKHINERSIYSEAIQFSAIKEAHISEAAVGSAAIQHAAIESAHIQQAAIDSAHLGHAIIKQAHMSDASITNAAIVNLAVDTAKIANAAITEAKIDDLAVSTAKIKDASITNAKIADASINSAKIEHAAIDTAHIKNGAITTALIAQGAIETAQIADASITDAKIVNMTANKLVAGTIDTGQVDIQGENGHLRILNNRLQVFDDQTPAIERVSVGDVYNDGSVYGFLLRGADGETVLIDHEGVYEAGITDGAITNPKISEGAVENRHITANTITGDKLVSETITAREISAKAITTNHIATNAITAASGIIADAAITEAMIMDAAITEAKIASASITNAHIKERLLANKIIVGADTEFENGYDPTEVEQAAKNYTDTKATDVLSAAEIVAKAEAELAETKSKAYADGIVSEEEQRAIQDAIDKLNEAKQYAEQQAEDALEEAKQYRDLWAYPDTVYIDGGNIYANSITANHLASNTITATSGVIANAAITNAMIQSVSADKITSGDLTVSPNGDRIFINEGHIFSFEGSRLRILFGNRSIRFFDEDQGFPVGEFIQAKRGETRRGFRISGISDFLEIGRNYSDAAFFPVLAANFTQDMGTRIFGAINSLDNSTESGLYASAYAYFHSPHPEDQAYIKVTHKPNRGDVEIAYGRYAGRQNSSFLIKHNHAAGSSRPILQADEFDVRIYNTLRFGLLQNAGITSTAQESLEYQMDSQNKIVQTSSAVSYTFDGVARHIFMSNGNKIGGSYEFEDGEILGMSPVDSPQVLIMYLISDLDLDENGVVVQLDDRFVESTSDFTVFPNNGKVISKDTDSFVIKGEGKADVQIYGLRKGNEHVFWTDMKQEGGIMLV